MILTKIILQKKQYKMLSWIFISTNISTTPIPKPFYDPFSGTTQVSWCQKRTCGLYGARKD